MSYADLDRYVKARGKRTPGWMPEYERELAEISLNYLAGHYQSMLDDLIDLMPPTLLRAALDAARELERNHHDSD